MSEISEKYWKRKIPVHQVIQTLWGEGKEIGVADRYIIVRLQDGIIKFLEEDKIVKKEGFFEYVE